MHAREHQLNEMMMRIVRNRSWRSLALALALSTSTGSNLRTHPIDEAEGHHGHLTRTVGSNRYISSLPTSRTNMPLPLPTVNLSL